MKLSRLVLTRVGSRVLAALAGVFALLQMLDLLDVMSEILDRGLGMVGVLHYALLRSPRLLEQAIPIAVLAGCLFAFIQLARENAVTAMRTIGVPVYSILAWAVPAAAAAVVFQFALGQWIAPAADIALSQWLAETAPDKPGELGGSERTFRAGHDIVTARAMTSDPSRLFELRMYRRDANGTLIERIAAATARFEGTAWQMTDTRTATVERGKIVSRANPSMAWTTTLRPSDIASAFGNPVDVSPAEARRALAEGAALRSPAFYETKLQRAWAAPIGSLVMLLLAVPVALVTFRGGSGSVAIAGALAAGLLFLVADGMLTALGESGAVPVVLAAWAAPCMFAALGFTMLLRWEG